MTTPHIIHTIEDLEALDPDTVLGVWHPELEMGCIFLTADEWLSESFPSVALAVIATAEQVRAARNALEENQK